MADYTTTKPEWAVADSLSVMSGIEGIKDTTVGNINPNLAKVRPKRRMTLTEDEIVEGVIKGDRVILSRAITLIESNNPKHFCRELVKRCELE